MKWEYLVTEINAAVLIYPEELNKFGKQGWEFVQSIIIKGNPWIYEVTFKRKLKENA